MFASLGELHLLDSLWIFVFRRQKLVAVDHCLTKSRRKAQAVKGPAMDQLRPSKSRCALGSGMGGSLGQQALESEETEGKQPASFYIIRRL